jgi:transcriptional regulator with GAF, ATPase, and Fis domain
VANRPETELSVDRGAFRTAKAHAIHTFEKDYLRWLMAETGWNVSRAARRAGKERRSIGKLLRKYGLRRTG